MSEDIDKEIGKEIDKETETETETEIEIPIENQEPENQPQKTTSKEPQTKVKDISKLTLEERAKIISDARNGIPSEHYDVIVLKNGNTRIVKKKIKTPSLSNRLINEQKQEVNNSKKLYMSDNQLMMEHIIELNNQINKLMTKQKKLKKKYKTLKYDIYEDVDENQITQETKQEQIKQEPTQEPTQETKQDVQQETKQDTAQDTKPSYRTAGIRVLPQKGWRSYISYL